MFHAVDTDGTGTISKDEFAKMYESMKSAIAQEHAQQTKVASDFEAVKKRTARAYRLSCLLFAVLIFFLLGNMGLMYKVVILTKESHVVQQGKESAMVDRSNHVVATATYVSPLPAEQLPALDPPSTTTQSRLWCLRMMTARAAFASGAIIISTRPISVRATCVHRCSSPLSSPEIHVARNARSLTLTCDMMFECGVASRSLPLRRPHPAHQQRQSDTLAE